ncbi:MAG: nucleotidyltransferase domain-containing protein [Campylobacterota bacterium]|nr:nucleotidyltransferase domain-containing protein [Campylobacterota bacterium]
MKTTKTEIITFLKEIKSELAQEGITTLALFGSFARDEASVYSDIDIAIQKDKNYLSTRSAYEYFDVVAKVKSLIEKKFHRNSDVFDLDSSSSMRETILKDIIYV